MKDFSGRDIELGDLVVWLHNKGERTDLDLAKVTRFTDHYVYIEYTGNFGKKEQRKNPSKILVIDEHTKDYIMMNVLVS